tara:strand:+ start:828 stop:1769 length:942 start_codon:yes stop_codon:yes gene_type:complete
MFLRLFLPLFLIISCSNDEKTFLAGKILNKTSNHISVYKGNKLINKTNIDSVGVFNIFLDSIDSGLYNFYHEPEFQYLIIDKNDQLQIRLNTLDFDESLVYTGPGSSKNNFLMDVFLRNELDELNINSKFDLDLNNFKQLVDSLYQRQLFFFNDFIKTNKISISSNEIIKSAILYPYISKFHSYVIRNNINLIDQGLLFEEFNSDIKFNIDALGYFKPYIDFLYLDIYNNVKNENNYKNTLDFNIKRLLVTDKIVKSELVKSRVLRFHAIGFLLQRENDSINNKFLESFFRISKNKLINKEISKLYIDLKNSS